MTIGQAAKQTGFSADTLRYYERIGLLPPVPRDAKGQRVYGDETAQLAALVKELKELGMPLCDIRSYVSLSSLGPDACGCRRELLLEARVGIARQIEKLHARMRLADTLLTRGCGAETAKN